MILPQEKMLNFIKKGKLSFTYIENTVTRY